MVEAVEGQVEAEVVGQVGRRVPRRSPSKCGWPAQRRQSKPFSHARPGASPVSWCRQARAEAGISSKSPCQAIAGRASVARVAQGAPRGQEEAPRHGGEDGVERAEERDVAGVPLELG